MVGEELAKTIIEDIQEELVLDDEKTIKLLGKKVYNAVRTVKNRRGYPSHFTDVQIEKDLENLYSNIRDLALYDFNQIGAEGQTAHSENGESRIWKDREECLKGVFAWAGF